VYGQANPSATGSGGGGLFQDNNTSSSSQYGVYAITQRGTGGFFENFGASTDPVQYGIEGEGVSSTAARPGLGVYGLGAGASAGGGFSGAGADFTVIAGDGIDVSGGLGSGDAIYAQQPSGDARFSFYGQAHIHGTNIAAGQYEQEAVYTGAGSLPLGRVVALDPANVTGGPLGVVAADPTSADAAIGVVSYRLVPDPAPGAVVAPGGAAPPAPLARPAIDAAATAVQPGDHVYITFAGRVRMHLAGPLAVGTRLAVGPDGTALPLAQAGPAAGSFGKVAARSLPDGAVDVIVNFP
jgi:hypothetical protein